MEADSLAWKYPRKQSLYDSAERWQAQAYRLLLERMGNRLTLAELRREVGNEEWLAALALLDLSPTVAADAAQYTNWSRDSGRFTYAGDGAQRVSILHPDPEMDWIGWVADVENCSRGWSSTERRLYKLIAALTTDQPLLLAAVLDMLGSLEFEVLDVLVQWASGGNNREYPGRLAVTGLRG